MVNWISDHVLRLGRTEFSTLGLPSQYRTRIVEMSFETSTPERFALVKTREGIEALVRQVDQLEPSRVLELGIWHGGSTAFLAALLRPEKLVAIDLSADRVTALDAFLAHEGLDASCRAHYGIDQADIEALRRVVHEEFGDAPLDLVLDDASHFGAETRASFNELFPRLRPGGLYVIEDWSWNLLGAPIEGEPMEGFIAEVVMAAGCGPQLIAGIDITWGVVTVERGPVSIEPDDFAIESWRGIPPEEW